MSSIKSGVREKLFFAPGCALILYKPDLVDKIHSLLNKRFLIRLHPLETIACKQNIPIPARGLGDMVFRKSVDHGDIVSH